MVTCRSSTICRSDTIVQKNKSISIFICMMFAASASSAPRVPPIAVNDGKPGDAQRLREVTRGIPTDSQNIIDKQHKHPRWS